MYKKMNHKELAKFVTSLPCGALVSFGTYKECLEPHKLPDYADDDVLESWDCIYTERGRGDNKYAIIDHYGGGQIMSVPLYDNEWFTDDDCEFIEDGLRLYFKNWCLPEYVYVRVENEEKECEKG